MINKVVVFVLIGILATSCAVHKVVAPVGSAKVELPTSHALISGWEQMGFRAGQQAPDFTLFSDDNKPFTLSKELKKGKPVVLINASYTCDVSRANLESILSFAKRYGSKATIALVYTLDAHPSDVPSPYSMDGKIETAPNNVRDKVQAKQPKTYAERQALASRWKTRYKIPLPILVDSPDNFFWTKFGQAPNMVYIIATDRKVIFKQAWFNKNSLDEALQKI